MKTLTPRRWLSILNVGDGTARLWLALLSLEAYLLLAYFAFTPAAPEFGEIRYLVYPFVWINAGLWGVRRVSPSPGSLLHRSAASLLAAAYFLVLLYVPGSLGFGASGAAVDFRVAMHAPGWGPLVAFSSPWLRLYLVPFEVLGYAALAYLVYANVLAVTRSALSGVLGLVTCVGCTVPGLVLFLGFLGGPTTGLTSTAYAWSYDIGTVVFLITVGLLVWGASVGVERSED